VAALLPPLAAVAGPPPVRDLAPGTPERKIVLDLLRPVMELEMRGPVEFRVDYARTLDDWAVVRVTPQRPGGAPIAMADTVFAEEAAMMDGLTTDALFRRRGERWYLITHVVGPTDMAASNWFRGYAPLRLLMPHMPAEETKP
jgi:hypothetical protein